MTCSCIIPFKSAAKHNPVEDFLLPFSEANASIAGGKFASAMAPVPSNGHGDGFFGGENVCLGSRRFEAIACDTQNAWNANHHDERLLVPPTDAGKVPVEKMFMYRSACKAASECVRRHNNDCGVPHYLS